MCVLLCFSFREFDGTSDLHTGISNTKGRAQGSEFNLIHFGVASLRFMLAVCVCVGLVYNYTRDGVRRDVNGWERCVSIPLVRPDMFHLLAQWDQYLDCFSDGPMWDPAWHK